MRADRWRGLACAFALVVTATTLVPFDDAAAASPKCNGEVKLCARSLGEVAFATTHNSMASTASGFVPPNQRRSMQSQLEHGIRGFQIDAYLGTPRHGRVTTDFLGPLQNTTELP